MTAVVREAISSDPDPSGRESDAVVAGRDPSARPAGVRRWRRRLVAIAGLAAVVGLVWWAISIRIEADEAARAEQITEFEAETGIRVERVVLTAAGGIAELHYWVLDPDKAIDVHDDENPPGLIDDATGAIIAVPFHDHTYQELHTGVLYRNMFMNGAGILTPDSEVTIVVGEARIEHIPVD